MAKAKGGGKTKTLKRPYIKWEAGQDGSKKTIRGVNNKKCQIVEIFLTCIDGNNESVTNK